jgi:hypothetical protein
MLSVTSQPFMLSITMLIVMFHNVFMLNVFTLSVVSAEGRGSTKTTTHRAPCQKPFFP